MTIRRKELSKVVSEAAHVSLEEAGEYLDRVFENMVETLEGGEGIKISGFGNFNLLQKRERTGRNPKTGEKMQIAGRRVVSFKASSVLRKAMNKGYQ
jgi:integration host factor subunit alpha